MKLSLTEWEKVQDFAYISADELNYKYGLNVKASVYRMYDGKMGIRIQVFDKYNNLFKEYFSGIHKTAEDYISKIKDCYFRIKEDCKK